MANAPKSEHGIVNDIDCYIAWPGQALAYQGGQMKFLALRELARSSLGAKFDVRKFHDIVLSTGAVPLDVLQANVHDWRTPPASLRSS